MAFGGTVKLMGESEYRQALQRCTQSLQTMSTALKNQTTNFNSNDKSIKSTAAMQKELNDTIKKQEAELTKAKNAYSQYGVALQAQTTRHNALNKEFKNAVTELDRIKKASGENSTEYKKQAEVVDKLGQELADSSSKLDENKRAMSNLKSEINNSTKTINNAKKEIDDLGKEAEQTGKQAENAGDGFTVFKGVLSNLATQGINVAINGIKKLGTALINVGKQAINSYAQYEQLVGGVETLFKDSAGIVQKYAENAYKTAGLSANEYMEQATSFSASLLQGLGGDTKKAAQIADMAIIDMSDNANKMGTSMEMIQNAYQGFAKQNYTMLDNLKLGYGGTKSEMARLVKESGILGKAGKDLTAKNLDQKVSFDQIIQAIHKVQENMGITGTTSKEAATTIEGSTKSMKASWQNLLTGISDDTQDLDKLIDNFIDSVITYSDNMIPRIKKTVDGIKRLINSIVTEVFPKLKKEIPELRPLIETFEWFIDHRTLVVGAIQAMVAAFAIKKVLTFTKGMSDLIKNILLATAGTKAATIAENENTVATVANTTAQTANTAATVAGATATGLLTKAANLLSAAWKTNPIGLIVTGAVALISVFGLLKSKTDELTEAEKEQQEALKKQGEEIQNNKEAWEDLQKTRQASIDAGMTEIANYQALWDELQGIVDQNGKVKKGYEERASFITSTLSEALGIEIKTVDGVIQKYGKLKNSIDEVMEKKKAQIILDAQESMYKEAIEKQADAVRKLNDIEQQLSDKKAERYELAKQYEQLQTELATANSEWRRIEILKEMGTIEKSMAQKVEETGTLQQQYKEQEGLLQSYAYNIGQYEDNMAKFHAGKYDEMTNVSWNYVKEYQKAGDAEKAQLEDNIKVTEKNLELLKQMKEDSGKDIYDSQIKAAEKQLKQQKEDLKKYQSATKEGMNNTNTEWQKGLANQLSTINGKKVEFKNAGDGQIQMFVDGVKVGEPKAEKEMKKFAEDMVKEAKKSKAGGKTAGEDLIDGVNNGVKNQNKQSGVFSSIASFGSKLLGKLKASLKEKSPSKATQEMGEFLLEGLGIGIDKEENSVLNQISNVGKNVLTALQDELNQNVRLSGIQANIDSPSSLNNANNYYSTVEAFKEALSDMKIELDDENVGKFIDKTVARTIYS